VTACARLCIDRLRAAKRERAAYEGPWLPEPIVVVAGDASADLERADDMTMAMLLVLERLTPRERAAYILREAFDYDYAEIGGVLKASPGACRQLASRAARRLRDERPRFATSRNDSPMPRAAATLMRSPRCLRRTQPVRPTAAERSRPPATSLAAPIASHALSSASWRRALRASISSS
jgi:hypothetical protein